MRTLAMDGAALLATSSRSMSISERAIVEHCIGCSPTRLETAITPRVTGGSHGVVGHRGSCAGRPDGSSLPVRAWYSVILATT